jgi:hypothetical protein
MPFSLNLALLPKVILDEFRILEMATKTPNVKELRSLRIAARDGDYIAARALLRLYGHDELAAEIKIKRPMSKRARIAVDALTCAIGTEWEEFLLDDPPPDRKPLSRLVFKDEG